MQMPNLGLALNGDHSCHRQPLVVDRQPADLLGLSPIATLAAHRSVVVSLVPDQAHRTRPELRGELRGHVTVIDHKEAATDP